VRRIFRIFGGDPMLAERSVCDALKQLWPEIDWIEDPQLRRQVTQTWALAFERSPLQPDDLYHIPFTLLVPNCPITFIEHKRCVVHIARASATAMREFMGRALPVNLDVVIAGAILADVGKLLEYEIGSDGKAQQSERGEALRHPFTGVALALECGVPDSVCHIIATHAAEGDLVKRTTEAFIVHHADFMAFLPFKNPKNIQPAGERHG
jgi:putative nucleotidyltransferase with HDIG domain